jgi:hypothetical protein
MGKTYDNLNDSLKMPVKFTATVGGAAMAALITLPPAMVRFVLEQTKRAEQKRTGYERAKDGETFYVRYVHGIEANMSCGGSAEDTLYQMAATTTDRQLMIDNARADTLWRQIRRYAAEHGGIPSPKDWKSSAIIKYTWHYDYNVGRLLSDATFTIIWCPIHFLSASARDACIEEFRSELIWYYAEYEAQLYD